MTTNIWPMPNLDRTTVYVDVDDTLLLWDGKVGDGSPRVNNKLVEEILLALDSGVQVYVWSRGGAEHARQACRYAGIDMLIHGMLGKPTHMLDNSYGWLDAVIRREARE